MTNTISGATAIARACPDDLKLREDALAARQLLAETVEAITPATPARKLLACLARYRAHLAALVAADTAKAPRHRSRPVAPPVIGPCDRRLES